MAELQTYIFPAIQAFFLLIIAIAWLVGFIRQRNFGFLWAFSLCFGSLPPPARF